MNRTRLIVVLLVALLAIFVTTSQAQPVEVVSELAMDSLITVDAIENIAITACTANVEPSNHVGKLLNGQNTLLDMTSTNINDETTAGTATTFAGIFAVNIGFQDGNQSTLKNILNMSAPIS